MRKQGTKIWPGGLEIRQVIPGQRHFTSNYTFDIGWDTISWCSKKQATLALYQIVLSSTEAEYNAKVCTLNDNDQGNYSF